MGIIYPLYIDKERLLDLYAQLFNGIPSYEKTTCSTNNKKQDEKVKKAGICSIVSGSYEKSTNVSNDDVNSKETTSTRTYGSMLSEILCSDIVKKNEINDIQRGDFAVLDVELKLNSLKPVFQCMEPLARLQQMSKDQPDNDVHKQIEMIIEACNAIMPDDELIDERKDYAIISRYSEDNLYKSRSDDLQNTPLKCLCYVKKVYSNGARLFKGSPISISKQTGPLISAIDKLKEIDEFDLNITFVPEIKDKKVYEIEAIAIF